MGRVNNSSRYARRKRLTTRTDISGLSLSLRVGFSAVSRSDYWKSNDKKELNKI